MPIDLTKPHYIDPGLSRGLVRQEMIKLDRGEDAAVEKIYRAVDEPMDRLGWRKKIDDEMLRKLDRNLRALPLESGVIQEVSVRSKLRTLLPKDAYVDGRGLVLLTDKAEGLFVLSSFRSITTPRSCNMSMLQAPVSFTRHLAERLLQRTRNDISTLAIQQIARSLRRSIGFVALAMRAASHLPEMRLAIPFGEGLILGDVMAIESELTSSMIHKTRQDVRRLQVDPAFETCGWSDETPFDTSLSLFFKANTFIGPREMADNQRQLHQELTFVATHYADACARAAEMTLWPEMPEFEPDGLNHVSEEDARGLRNAVAAITDLIMTRGYARGMGNSREPHARPLNVFDEIDAHFRPDLAQELELDAPAFGM